MLTIPGYNFLDILTDSDVLLIVPPFAELNISSLALHILQACARKEGFSVKVFYANLAFASWIGEENYQFLTNDRFYGNILFSEIVYNGPLCQSKEYNDPPIKNIHEIKSLLKEWLTNVTNAILKFRFKVVGCTTTFVQTNPSIAFLNTIKNSDPNIITIMGGANCQGEMANGILSLSNSIDYIFTGESEIVFPKFLKDLNQGITPQKQIIHEELSNIDDIPVPDYTDYIRQLSFFTPGILQKKNIYLGYETSRGCWWGQKHQCNFCGVADHIDYREKSTDIVLQDLKYLSKNFGSRNIFMADVIMPYRHLRDLLPRITNELPNVKIFFETKANMNFEQLLLLKKAGINQIQPGIESLSTSVLRKTNKGVTARQNISLLRNCKSIGITVNWNFMYAFPNDSEEDYKEMDSMIPLIVHLQPPTAVTPLIIARFSPYYDCRDKFGIKNIIPHPYYQYCFPKESIEEIAFDFQGEYSCYSHLDNPSFFEIINKIKKWREFKFPKLKLLPTHNSNYLLIDNRGLSEPLLQTITEKQAMVVMFDHPIEKCEGDLKEEIAWGLQKKLLIKIDSWYISIVNADPEVLMDLKKSIQTNKG